MRARLRRRMTVVLATAALAAGCLSLSSCSDYVDVIAMNPCSDAVTLTLGGEGGTDLRVAPESFGRASEALADDPDGDGQERVDYAFEGGGSGSVTVEMGQEPVVVFLSSEQCP